MRWLAVVKTACLVACLSLFVLVTPISAADTMKSGDIEYRMKVQRACHVAIWALPAVAIYDLELAIK